MHLAHEAAQARDRGVRALAGAVREAVVDEAGSKICSSGGTTR
jgi:hypothetical protein